MPHRDSRHLGFPQYRVRRELTWLALTAIDAFFAWTEHLFVHLAVLTGTHTTAASVEELAAADWKDKFQTILDLGNPTTKRYYDDLMTIRRQLRNVVTHGAFGKSREAFEFHSKTGAVPVRLPRAGGRGIYRFGHGIDFVDDEALTTIDRFIEYLWSGDLSRAKTYLDSGHLPISLDQEAAKEFVRAMESDKAMDQFVTKRDLQWTRAINMDW